jgi:hypothetical protein
VVLLDTPVKVGFWKMLRSSSVMEQLFVPQEGFGIIEVLNGSTNKIWWFKFWCCQMQLLCGNPARKIWAVLHFAERSVGRKIMMN